MKLLSVCFIFLFTLSAYAQQQQQQHVQYDEDFRFKDGVYLSFLDFKNNNPIPITHLLSEFDIRAKDYILETLNNDTLVYYDNLLEERAEDIRQVWGFCADGKVHIGFNTVERNPKWEDRDWFPLVTIGAYSSFTAYMMMTRYIPPTPTTMMPTGGIGLYDDGMDPNGNYYQESMPMQMLLDFKTGNLIQLAVGDLNTVSADLITKLIGSDAQLLGEYEAMSKRDQKQTSMFYIRKFNERNPILFPSHD